MDNPPEKPSLRETNLTPADTESASAAVPADFAKRLEEFEAETRRRRKYSKWAFYALCSGLPFAVMLLLLFVPMFPHYFAWLFLACCLAGCAALLVVCLRAITGEPSGATLRFIAERNPQAIGPLLMRLDILPYHREVELIWQAIVEQLKRISLEEADALPREVRDRLNRRLSSSPQFEGCTAEVVEFCLAWLKVLEQIGNTRDLRVVESLTEMFTNSRFHRTIRDAAVKCLPHIEARIAAQEPGRTLLRASDSPPAAPETLLRPASAPNPTAPKELLRPVEPEEES